jgi:uncharacterized protein (TIGR03437 family)
MNILFRLILLLVSTTCALAQPMQQGDGIWIRNAAYGESQTFDACNGHQPQNGQYHQHVQPICLRAQLNDNLVAVKSGRLGTYYQEKAAPWTHSPILGWAFDGYPIYGPYGYSEAQNASSAVRRMRSSFRLRAMTDRSSLPTWALAFHTNVAQQLSGNQIGPAISDAYPLGRYIEDFEYVAGLGDLDVHNGRFAITPEFPQGTYAYFITIDEAGNSAFPYILGVQYNGTASGGRANNVPANAQDYFNNGQTAVNAPDAPAVKAWFTRNAQQPAKAITAFDPSAGATTTWPNNVPSGVAVNGGVTTATLADAQRVRYTDTTVYVNSNNLASHVMGPWFEPQMTGGVFQNFAAAQNNQLQIPRTPASAATKTTTPMGAIGVWVNGVAVFNMQDGASYSGTTRADVGGGRVVQSILNVSSASFEGGPTAPGAMVTAFPLFGMKLATTTEAASSPAWPTSLGGATVTVRDAAGVNHAATISYAAAGQLNYRIPENVALGIGTVTITANGASASGGINVIAAYSNIFQFTSAGLAAAQLLRVRDGKQTYENIFQVENGVLTPAALDLGPESDQVFLVLYGTGLGKTGGNPTVTLQLNGASSPLAYAGPQGTFTGLDQYNILLPRTLIGRGRVDLVVTANGKASNPVFIIIK